MVRIANLNDFAEIEGYAVKFLEGTEYKDHYDLHALRIIIGALLNSSTPNAVMFIEPGKGFIAGRAVPFLFGQKFIASEIGWWVEPEYRKEGVGNRLLLAFEEWAKSNECELIAMISLDESLGGYYEKYGYRLVERSYMKEIN